MNNQPEAGRTSGADAFIAGLYARAEREILPTHPDYDPGEGLERFLTRIGSSTGAGLFVFADIVSYSRLSARLQQLSQSDLVSILDHSMAEAGVQPGQVAAQDQGDARLLIFPPGTDVAKVLAVLPRTLNDELMARNQDMAEHARMRVRLAFAIGASSPGVAGLVGTAPIAVARIANSAVFRDAMRMAPQAHCGLMIDDYLYGQWVRQDLRADMNPDDYAAVRVLAPDKGFESTAWMRLFGYSGQQVKSLLP